MLLRSLFLRKLFLFQEGSKNSHIQSGRKKDFELNNHTMLF